MTEQKEATTGKKEIKSKGDTQIKEKQVFKPIKPPAIPVYEKSVDSNQKKSARPAHYTNRRKKNNKNQEKSDPLQISTPKLIQEPVENPTISYIAELQTMKIDALIKYAASLGLMQITSLPRSQIVFEIVKLKSQDRTQLQIADGILELLSDGYGFLRSPIYSYAPSAEDIYVPHNLIRRNGLKTGDRIVGPIRLPEKKDRYFALHKITEVNGLEPEKQKRKAFENLVALFPEERFIMETIPSNYSGRILDLTAPIGKGQRGLIVAPPKTGKTILMQNIAHSITANSPKTEMIVLMIDERPEEVTDMKKVIKGEVVSSTFDEPPERHVQVAEMIIEKAKRMVEQGKDVVILLDSLTRLARAYNTVQPHSGKILTGGIDASSLHKPKRFFGAARNIDGQGSLTIIATALIDTGSKMDEVIYEEFKGTGNMELVLDRQLSDRRVFPAIDVIKSGTRKEELLYHEQELEKIALLQKAISDLSPLDAMKIMLSRIKKVKTNTEFLLSIKE